MSDSKNTPPSDEWIKSLYASDSEGLEEGIPQSVDAAILAQAQLAQGTGPGKLPRYAWIYGTAASAIFGFLLLMQIPTIENQSPISREPGSSQPTMSKQRQEEDQLAGAPAIPQAKEISVLAGRTAMKMRDNTLVSEALSDAAGSDFTDCTKHVAYFTNRLEQQTLVACQSSSHLRFEFEQKSESTCNEPYYFDLESSTAVPPGRVDTLDGIQKIIIKHGANTFTLQCDTGQWKLLLMEQP